VAYETSVKRISKRNWPQVVDAWAPFISALDPARFQFVPVSGVKELPDLQATLEKLPHSSVEVRVEPLSSAVAHLEETVFLTHKAANILCAAHDQAVGGLPTWSLATAYQAAMFASIACCGFLGVTLHAYVKKSFIVDFFPEPSKDLSRKALQGYRLGSEAHIIRFESTVSHFHHWALFRRIIRTTTDIDFDEEIILLLDKVQDKLYAEQRNGLHYNHRWQYDDLHKYIDAPGLLVPDSRKTYKEMFDPQSPGFSMALGTALVSLATTLLAGLSRSAPLLAEQHAKLQTACAIPRMKLRAEYESASGIALI